MNFQSTTRRAAVIAAMVFCIVGAGAHGAPAATPDAARLLEQMRQAMVPATGQLTQVRIAVQENEQADERLSWQALVLRQRFTDGARNAVLVTAPDSARGTVILTAPGGEEGRGLWVYAPAERRTREFSPLLADRHFLRTDLDFATLGLTTRELREPRVLGAKRIAGHDAWQVEAKPARDVYYSRLVTWIDQDTKLPLRREYFDRAERLWKVCTFDTAVIEGVPSVLAVHLRDVQSRATSDWRVTAISYVDEGAIKASMLAPDNLGELAERPFWRQVTPQAATVADAATPES